MKKLLFFLALIFSLLVIGALILTRNVVSYSQNPLQNFVSPSPVFEKPQLPPLGGFRSPHAILVLDVSGSMVDNDPGHLQTEAVLRFYDVFLKLSREVLPPGNTARIAIVLFASSSQIINWGQNQNPWLDVTQANTPRFERAVKTYLGLSGEDPRKGQDTDYLSGLQEVAGLVETIQEPPAVIFMTDGRFDPHPQFSPFTTGGTNVFGSSLTGTSTKFGDAHWLPWDGPASGILNRLSMRTGDGLVKIPRERFAQADLVKYQEAVKNVVHQMEKNARFSLNGGVEFVPLFWAPIFLGQNPDDLKAAKDVLALPKRAIIQCRDPQNLVGDFVAVLAEWFTLSRLEIAPGSSSFRIPVQTQAFAVTLKTTSTLDQVVLRQGKVELALSGRGKSWAGVGSGDGDWDVQQKPSLIAGGALYLKPRFEWVLYVPRSVSVIGDDQDRFSVDLLLYSLREKEPVPAGKVFPHLPQQLMSEIELPGGHIVQLPLIRTADKDPDSFSAYQGLLDFKGVKRGSMTIRVDLSPFRELNLPFMQTSLEKQVLLRPSVNFILKDVEGRPTGIYVENIPAHQQAIRRLLERGQP